MRDIIEDIRRWQDEGKTQIALATIVETRGSSCDLQARAWLSIVKGI